MRQLISFLALALLPATASAVILFNGGAEITATGTFPASKETQQGGLILYLKGDPDGATIDLETQPFRTAQGPVEWIPLAECSVTALPAVCKVAVGQGAIRLNVTGGLGSPAIHAIAYEASAVVGEVGGAGGGVSGLLDGPVTFGDPAGALAQDPIFFYEDVFNRLGLGTATPISPLDVRPAFLAGDGSAIEVDIGGFVIGSAFALRATGSTSINLDVFIENEVGAARFNAFSSGSGDAFVLLESPSQGWSLGVDQSDSDRFHITSAVNLGSSRHVTIDTAGNVSVGDGARFEFPQSAAPPTGTESGSWWDETNDVLRLNDGTNDLVLTPRLGGELDNVAYVIDTAVPPDQDVHVSLFNSIGGAIDTVPHCYLTDDPGGIGKSADIPTAITPGTNQFLTQIGADIQSFFLGSNALGVIDLTFNESGGPSGDSYRLACLVDGLKFVSGIIIPRP